MRAMRRAWILLLCLVAGSRQLSITEFSVPAAIELGQEAELKCKYDLLANESEKSLFVKWWWTPINRTSDQRTQLYQRIAGYDAVAIRDNVEIVDNDNIKLLNVTHKDSGTYECEVSNIDEVRQHQTLVVFSMGTGPSLNVTLAEDEPAVEVTCEAFDVTPYPDISISLNGRAMESSGYVSEPRDGLYDVYENATFTLEEANGGNIVCELFFKDENVTHPPFVATQTFEVPAETGAARAAQPGAAADPASDTFLPGDNGTKRSDCSWLLVATTSLAMYVWRSI